MSACVDIVKLLGRPLFFPLSGEFSLYGMQLTWHITAAAHSHRLLQVAALAVGCGMVMTGQLTAEQLTNFIMWVE